MKNLVIAVLGLAGVLLVVASAVGTAWAVAESAAPWQLKALVNGALLFGLAVMAERLKQ